MGLLWDYIRFSNTLTFCWITTTSTGTSVSVSLPITFLKIYNFSTGNLSASANKDGNQASHGFCQDVAVTLESISTQSLTLRWVSAGTKKIFIVGTI